MSINRLGDNGGEEFKHPHLRELDTLMLALHPAKRTAFLESAYVRVMSGNFEPDFIVQLAALLRKWGSDRHNFAPHIEKLMAKSGESVQDERDNTAELVKKTIDELSSR